MPCTHFGLKYPGQKGQECGEGLGHGPIGVSARKNGVKGLGLTNLSNFKVGS